MTGFTFFVAIVAAIGGGILCVISVALSFILFWGVSQDATLQMVWGGAAIGFELIKFSIIPIATYTYNEGKKLATSILATSFLVLMAISITASVGSLAKSTKDQDTDYYSAIDSIESKKEEIAGYRDQIKSRAESIEVYQGEKLITAKANPLQEKTDQDLVKISELNEQIKLIIIPKRSALSEGIASIAILLGLNERSAQSNVFAIFSLLLDTFAGLSLIVSEAIFLAWKAGRTLKIEGREEKDKAERHLEREHELQVKRLDVESEKFAASEREKPRLVTEVPTPAKATVIPLKADDDDLAIVRRAIVEGIVPSAPSERNLIKSLNMTEERAVKVLAQL